MAVNELLTAAVESIGGQTREGQEAMAEAVAAALREGSHLVVQAGTGTGKSLAYLVPSIQAALRQEKAVIVATATLALQNQLVERDLPRLVEAISPKLSRPPTFAVLKGRGNYLCLERLDRGGHEDEDEGALFDAPKSFLGRQATRVREWADQTTTGDQDDLDAPVDPRVWRAFSVSGRECVGASKCRFGEECFAEKARQRAATADVVITNHAMLAIDVLDKVPVLPEHQAVIVDEAHELADRATQAVTMDLSGGQVDRASRRASRFLEKDTTAKLRDAGEALDETLKRFADAGSLPAPINEMAGDLLLSLTMVRDACRDALSEMKVDGAPPEELASLSQAKAMVDDVHNAAGDLLNLNEHDVAWIDGGDGRGITLRIAPLSVAGLLRTALFDERPVVLTSATLTLGGSFDAVAGSVGLPLDGKGWKSLDVGSPFDYPRQGILYCPAHLPPPGRDGMEAQALDELADLIDAAGGRTLALFSSWRGVERAAEHLQKRFDGRTDRPLIVQRKGDSVAPLVKSFAGEPRSTLLGTLSLWQGVDVPGPSCTLVVIDRIPFPRPDDPVVAARSKAADESGGNGFMQVSVPKAALLLAQGAGRLIRSMDDKGVVAILDSRLARARYGGYLKKSLPPLYSTFDGAKVKAALARLDSLNSEA